MCGAMMNGMGMWGAGWMAVTGLLLVLLVGATAVAVAVVAVGGRRRPAVAASGASLGESGAVAVAKERYARGDIDHAELERILDTVLRGEEHPPGRPR